MPSRQTFMDAMRASDSYLDVKKITPSNTQDLDEMCSGILVGATAGNVQLQTAAGNFVVIPFIANQVIKIRATRILATGTTATPIYALYG